MLILIFEYQKQNNKRLCLFNVNRKGEAGAAKISGLNRKNQQGNKKGAALKKLLLAD